MRATHPIDHLGRLTTYEARRAAWSSLDPDVDYAWTSDIALQLEAATDAMLMAADAIIATDNRGRALRAVAVRLGPVEAAMMIPAAAEACRTAASRIEGCSHLRGERLVRRAAETLLAA